MTDEELKQKCKERAKIFQQAMESCHSSDLTDCIEWLADRITELEKEISILLSCKNCPENKGGFICQKEYEDKCLAQKIQFIKELQEENAGLKERLLKVEIAYKNKSEAEWRLNELYQKLQIDYVNAEKCSREYFTRYRTLLDRCIKAEEIIKKFSEFVSNEIEYDPEHPQEHTDLWNELCKQSEQFLKEVSE